MFVRPFATLLLIIGLAVPAWAQDQRGSIEGVVRDSSGAVLPGATVDAQSNVGPVASTITDANGCQSTCCRTLAVNPPPPCEITGDDTICDGETTQFCAPAGLAS